MQAYTQAFLPSDDVTLIVHSYEKHLWDGLQNAMGNVSQPAVIVIQVFAALHLCLSMEAGMALYMAIFMYILQTECSKML